MLIETIAEENDIDEGRAKDYIKKLAVGSALAGSLFAGRELYKDDSSIKKGLQDKVASIKNQKKINHSGFLMKQAFVESRYKKNAISPKGAKGLTQIMPSTLQDYLKSTGKNIEDVDLFDIKHSVDIQIHTMQNLYNATFIEKENQSEIVRLAKTLAAYNWGRGNLSNFLEKLKKNGENIYTSLDWVEKIPNKETREYINKILLKTDEKVEEEYKIALAAKENKPIVNLYKKQINLEK